MEIKKSSIHGLGVFASEDIPKNKRFYCYCFRIKLDELSDEGKKYCFPYKDGLHAALPLGNFAGFLNHNYKPNLILEEMNIGSSKICFRSNRKIEK